MKISRFLIFVFETIILSSSCSSFMVDKQEEYLEDALEMAGDNRYELEKVLNHYSDNPERLKAAQWLISNMPLHHTKTGTEVTKYRRYYETLPDYTCVPVTCQCILYEYPSEVSDSVEKGQGEVAHSWNCAGCGDRCGWTMS